jgi:DNA invertase Pin-like site-specific DNA recombinase
MCKLLVGYIRVSTKKQGESGLGLEAQLKALQDYASQNDGVIIKIYREIESGRKNNRPELANAIAHTKRSRATLVIAKFDRLARNVHFVSGLMESGVDFVACNFPTANRLTIHILAAVAEDEARAISQRTKEALAAYKARGGVLGSAREGAYKVTREDSKKGGQAVGEKNSKKAIDAYSDIAPQMLEWRNSGLSQWEIAHNLNAGGHTTRTGKPWNQVQVLRVLRRFTNNTQPIST